MEKKLNHIALFESYLSENLDYPGPNLRSRSMSSGGGQIQIGSYSDGGHGSHIAILDRSGADFIRRKSMEDEFIEFIPVISVNSVPEALLYILDYNTGESPKRFESNPSGWNFYPLTKREAMEFGGESSYICSTADMDTGSSLSVRPTDPTIQRMLSATGYDPISSHGDVSFSIGIIFDPKPNTIYWSDGPDASYGYNWANPRPMTLSSVL